jgi:small nuclear ribonucleoprotein (snRNP)-like protein
MLFYSFFKTLHGKEVVVELKNDLSIRGKFVNNICSVLSHR